VLKLQLVDVGDPCVNHVHGSGSPFARNKRVA
jgi:hypothetical protein